MEVWSDIFFYDSVLLINFKLKFNDQHFLIICYVSSLFFSIKIVSWWIESSIWKEKMYTNEGRAKFALIIYMFHHSLYMFCWCFYDKVCEIHQRVFTFIFPCRFCYFFLFCEFSLSHGEIFIFLVDVSFILVWFLCVSALECGVRIQKFNL